MATSPGNRSGSGLMMCVLGVQRAAGQFGDDFVEFLLAQFAPVRVARGWRRHAFRQQADRSSAFATDTLQQGEIVAFADSENGRNLLPRSLVGEDAGKERARLLAPERIAPQRQRP